MQAKKLFAAGCVLALAGTAWAYMLPAGSLVKKMEDRRSEQPVHSVVVHGSFTLTGGAAQSLASRLGRFAEAGELNVPAVASYKMPGRCRIELELGSPDAGAPPSFAVDRNGQVSGTDDLKAAQLMLQLGCPFLASRGTEDTARLIEWAKNSGVDFAVTSLARFNNAIAEVIGAGPHDGLKPQLWIDKDEFVPLRVILKQGGTFYDLRFDPGAGIIDAHPRTIELWQMGTGNQGQGETLLGRFSAEKIEPNAKVEDKIF